MTTEDLNDTVLAAFRVESREQLEQIRALAASFPAGESAADDPRVQEAFRLAHSFKGGARICDLHEAEQLGHGLETVLERVCQGGLRVTAEVTDTVTLVLDLIEDWLAALEGQEAPPDASRAFAAIERLLESSTTMKAGNAKPKQRNSALSDVFRQEYAEHAASLRRFMAVCRESAYAPDSQAVADACRIAHTLAGAAGLAGVAAVAETAQAWDDALKRVKRGEAAIDPAWLERCEAWLAAMEDAMRLDSSAAGPSRGGGFAASSHDRPPSATANADAGEPLDDGAEQPKAGTPVSVFDTVRVGVDSLDRLVRSSGSLWAECQQVEKTTAQLAAFRREVDELDHARRTIRENATTGLHQLQSTPGLERVAQYLENVDRQVTNLAKNARRMVIQQRRTSWAIRSRCRQIQREVRSARTAPAQSIYQGFRKMVRDLAAAAGKEIEFRVTGWDVCADRMILQALKDSLMHVLRNCVTHGIESAPERERAGKPAKGLVSMELRIVGGRLQIVVEDDGQGVDVKAVANRAVERGLVGESAAARQSSEEIMSLVFEPGFTTAESATELAGRGLGLSIARDSVARLQGDVRLAPRLGGGTRVTFAVPVSISTHRLLLVKSAEQTLAIPIQGIERLLRLRNNEVETIEGRPVVMVEKQPVPLTRLADLLGWATPTREDNGEALSVVLVHAGSRRLAVVVDRLVEERDGYVLDLDEFSRRNELAGAVVLDEGQLALVLQPSELFDRSAGRRSSPSAETPAVARQPATPRVLIVDDSFTTRTLEKSILEAHGYQVGVAVDGVEALNQLRRETFDLVISDIEMPALDGFALLEQMKADRRLAKIPVILVTSRDRQEDQQRGLQLGAEAYILKRKFDHRDLLATIQQLL